MERKFRNGYITPSYNIKIFPNFVEIKKLSCHVINEEYHKRRYEEYWLCRRLHLGSNYYRNLTVYRDPCSSLDDNGYLIRVCKWVEEWIFVPEDLIPRLL